MILVILLILLIAFYKPIKHGLYDGWNGTTEYRTLYDPSYIYYLENLERIENKKEEIKDEITMLESVIRNRQQISYELEKELETCEDIKRRQAIMSKLITLDKQGFKDRKILNKLYEDLEL